MWAVTLVTLCFCLFCCCFCSSMSARASLITQSKLPSARQCQRVRVCPFLKTQWHWGPFSEAVVILKMSQSILRCIVVIQSGNKSHSYSALLPLMPRQWELLHILTECISEYCPSSFPTQPTLQLQQETLFRKGLPLLSLICCHSLMVLLFWLQKLCSSVLMTFPFICGCFLTQVEPFEDAPDSQGAVNMVLRLRQVAANELTVWKEPFFLE